MGLVYLFFRIYPFIGIIFTIACFDLAQKLKRKGNKAWIGMVIFALIFIATTVAWIAFRGDKHADAWFIKSSNWIKGK